MTDSVANEDMQFIRRHILTTRRPNIARHYSGWRLRQAFCAHVVNSSQENDCDMDYVPCSAALTSY